MTIMYSRKVDLKQKLVSFIDKRERKAEKHLYMTWKANVDKKKKVRQILLLARQKLAKGSIRAQFCAWRDVIKIDIHEQSLKMDRLFNTKLIKKVYQAMHDNKVRRHKDKAIFSKV